MEQPSPNPSTNFLSFHSAQFKVILCSQVDTLLRSHTLLCPQSHSATPEIALCSSKSAPCFKYCCLTTDTTVFAPNITVFAQNTSEFAPKYHSNCPQIPLQLPSNTTALPQISLYLPQIPLYLYKISISLKYQCICLKYKSFA